MKTHHLLSRLSLFIITIGIVFSQKTTAQDSIQWYAQTHVVTSSNELVPLWIQTNHFGTINNFGKGEIGLLAGAAWKTQLNTKIDMIAGMEGYASDQWDYKALSQLYAEFRWGTAQLIIGKRNLDYLNSTSQQLPFINFRNIRPFPAISFGFTEYTNIPYLNGYLQFKANFLQGILNGDRDPVGVKHPLYHFKNLYLKTGNYPLQVFAGMNHGVIFGGTMQDGTKIPVDLINTYLINSSEKVGEVLPGEGINQPGEHLGFVDMGIILDLKKVSADFTYQRIMTDYSGLTYSHDHNMVFHLRMKGKHLISSINYEYYHTKHQSGVGMEKNYYETIDNYTQYLTDNFGYTGPTIASQNDFLALLSDYLGSDMDNVGRDNYFNNGIYPLGHFYDQHFFGFPIFHSNQQIAHFKNFDGNYYNSSIGNNRVVAHHFAAEGWISPVLSYQAKATLTKNYGTYAGFYTHDFIERENYYFKEGKQQNYFSLELAYANPHSPFSYQTSIGLDTGELYDSFGIMLSVTYTVGKFR